MPARVGMMADVISNSRVDVTKTNHVQFDVCSYTDRWTYRGATCDALGAKRHSPNGLWNSNKNNRQRGSPEAMGDWRQLKSKNFCVHLNLAYRWFYGLGLDSAVPDHSTFSKNPMAAFATAMRSGMSLRRW